MMKRRIPLTLGAAIVAALGMAAVPGAASAESAVAARLSFSFGAGESRISLGLGAQEQRPGALQASARPAAAPRPLAFRPLAEISGRVTASGRRLEDLRLNGLPLRSRALNANEGQDAEEDGEASEGGGGNAALIVGGVVVGVLIFGAVLADDFGNDLGDAIAGG